MYLTDVTPRIQLKNILFCSDFSPSANAAAPYAAELSKHYGGKLYALHVRPPAVNPMAPPATWSGLEEAAEIEAEQQKRKLLDTFPGVQLQVLISEGDLWLNVADTIKQHNVDLVVVGTRGRSGLSKLLLGSGAEEIFRQAGCPVLTVGPHSLGKLNRGGEFTHILFATDLSPASDAAGAYAISLAQEYQAHLTLVHVLGASKADDLVQPSSFTASKLLHDLVPAEAKSWCDYECIVEQGEAAENILKVASRQKANLIVLAVRQPAGFPIVATHLPMATAHKVVSRANCPVLTIRA